ncbi:MAG: hypothetical protein P8186_31200 [Anaerolineae bacterium]
MRTYLIVLLGFSLLLLPAMACTITLPAVKTETGELRQESVQVPLDDATAATVDITFGAGECGRNGPAWGQAGRQSTSHGGGPVD